MAKPIAYSVLTRRPVTPGRTHFVDAQMLDEQGPAQQLPRYPNEMVVAIDHAHVNAARAMRGPETSARWNGRNLMTSRCPVCGSSLVGRRSDSVTCSPACRREASRLRAVLAGRGDGPYVAVDQLLGRARRRAKAAQTRLSATARSRENGRVPAPARGLPPNPST